jgi:hypothetical protein
LRIGLPFRGQTSEVSKTSEVFAKVGEYTQPVHRGKLKATFVEKIAHGGTSGKR